MVSTVFIFCKCLKPGEEVKEGDILASIYTNIDNPIFNLERIFEIS